MKTSTQRKQPPGIAPPIRGDDDMLDYTFDVSCIWAYTNSVTAVSPRRIAIVLDGTRSSENALPCAADLAHTYEAELHVIYSFKPGNMSRASDLMIVAHTRPFEKARQDASLYVKTHCNKLRAQKIDVRGHTIEGDSLTTLCGYLSVQHIDLVVMARPAHTWIGQRFLGDRAAAIRRRTGITVLNVDP